jgi:hypothetical protein
MTPGAASGSDFESLEGVSLRQLNLEDPTGALDFINVAVDFIGNALLGETDERDVLNRDYCDAKKKVERYCKLTNRWMETAAFHPVRGMNQRSVELEGKVAIFHPQLPYLIAAGGGPTADVVTVLQLDERQTPVPYTFRTSVVTTKCEHHISAMDQLLSPTHSISSHSLSSHHLDRTPRSLGSFGGGLLDSGPAALPPTVPNPSRPVTAIEIIDPARDPKLLLAHGDGSVSIFGNLTTPDTYHIATFPTMPIELATNNHFCDVAYQQEFHLLHVTGFGGFVTTWDLSREFLIDERRESFDNAMAINCSFFHPCVFGVGYSKGVCLLYDLRTQTTTSVVRVEMPAAGHHHFTVGALTFDRLSPSLLTAAAGNGVVAVWDIRRIGHSSPTGSGYLRTFSVHPQPQAQKPSAYSVEDYSAIDIHSITSPNDGEPYVVAAGPSKSQVSKGQTLVRKAGKGMPCTSVWHPFKYRCAILYGGGKAVIMDQPSPAAATSAAADAFSL